MSRANSAIDDDNIEEVNLPRLTLYFLRLGATGFGGPIALAGHMQQTLVEERRWIAGEEYVEGLARSLVGHPRMLLLDEPLSSLDPELRATLRGELRRLQRALGLTTIYVTHDREDAAALAACTMEMRAGRIISSDANRAEERVKADQ
jgi:ABC-type thiamine transport system ATPase subunit